MFLRWSLVAIEVVAIGTLLAACTSGPSVPGVASIKSPAKTPRTTASKYQHSALGFSLCMRAHGISDFPEPSAAGPAQITLGSSSDLNPSNPRFQTAFSVCRSVLGISISPAQRAAQLTRMLKFAKCMRAHGVTDFPDPSGSGVLELHRGAGGGGFNPNNPVFQSASRTCSFGGFGRHLR
ncbi:MAG: hypothetical protein WB770_06290 [Acidimicrobiales bacterium]